MRQPALETLARHRRPIAAAWWTGVVVIPLGCVVIAAALIRRGRNAHDLRWVA